VCGTACVHRIDPRLLRSGQNFTLEFPIFLQGRPWVRPFYRRMDNFAPVRQPSTSASGQGAIPTRGMLALRRPATDVVVWVHEDYSGDAIVASEDGDRVRTALVPVARLIAGDFDPPADSEINELEFRIATSIVAEHRFWRFPAGASASRKRVAGRLYDTLGLRDPFAIACLDFVLHDDLCRVSGRPPVPGS
jgi:hypothetical protein